MLSYSLIKYEIGTFVLIEFLNILNLVFPVKNKKTSLLLPIISLLHVILLNGNSGAFVE